MEAQTTTKEERTLLVRGTSGISTEMLELFFENERRSGGGSIESISIPEENVALITYCDSNVVDRVLARGPRLTITDQTLTVGRLSKPDLHRIMVHGINPSTTKELLVMFFESVKRSSGGDIMDIQYDEGSGVATITFEDSEVAERVLARRNFTLNGAQLTVSAATSEELSNTCAGCARMSTEHGMVFLQGLPSDIEEDILEMWLENKKTGGGEIKSINLDRDTGTAAVTFVDEKVAQQMCEKQTVVIDGTKLVATKNVSPVKESNKSTSSNDVCLIRISDVPNISKNYLKLVVEKELNGKVDSIQMYPDISTAVVRIHLQQEAASLVLGNWLRLEGKNCSITPLYSDIHEEIEGSCAISVTGLNQTITDDFLEVYFSNPKRSGGRDVKSVYMVEGENKSIITFSTANAVKSVLAMQSKQQLKLKDAELHVEALEPLPPPPLINEPTEPHKFILLGTQNVTKEELEQFLFAQNETTEACHSSRLRLGINKILHSFERKAVLLEFSADPDYRAMLRVCAVMPFKDRMVTMEKLPLPTMIQVIMKNIPDRGELELYFQHSSSGGSIMRQEMTIYEKEQCAVIDYGDTEVVKSVLKKEHYVKGQPVKVDVFYPTFGICPYQFDPTQPRDEKPKSFSFTLENHYIMKYVLDNPEGINLLEKLGKQGEFMMCAEKSFGKQLHISYCPQNVNRRQDANSWQKQCTSILEKFCACISTEIISTWPQCFSKLCIETKRLLQGNDSVLAVIDEDKSAIILVGLKPKPTSLMKQLREELSVIEQDHQLHFTQLVTEIVELDFPTLMLIKGKQLLKASLLVKINFIHDGIELQGLQAEVDLAKLWIYENIIPNVKSTSWQCTRPVLKFMQMKSAKQFIIRQLRMANITCIVEVKPPGICLSAMSSEELQSALTILKREITETDIPLLPKSQSLTRSEMWNSLKEHLLKQYKDLLYIDVSSDKLRIVTISSQSNEITCAIESFFSENVVCEETFDTKQERADLLTTFYEDELLLIEKKYIQSRVKIRQTRNGFRITGKRAELHLARDDLESVCDQIRVKDFPVSQPSIAHFLSTTDGKRAIKSTENALKVRIVESRNMTTKKQKTHQRRDQSLGRRVIKDSTSKVTGLIGSLEVAVKVGDITKEDVDVLINFTNNEFNIRGGISKAITDAAGPEIEQECKQIGCIEAFGITSAGRLSCKQIVHFDSSQDLTNWETSFLRVLTFINAQEMKSLAIPAIGTEWLGRDSRIVCGTILRTLEKFASMKIEKVLQDIRIVAFEEQIFTVFRRCLPSHFEEDPSEMITAGNASASCSDLTTSDEIRTALNYKVYGMCHETIIKAIEMLEKKCMAEIQAHVY